MSNYDMIGWRTDDVEYDASNVPDVIQSKFANLNELKKNVDIAVEDAESAMNSARAAADKPTGLFRKAEAIEALQGTAENLAKAQISAVQAQKVSFEYQKKFAEVAKFLLELGVSSIAMNRVVVRELELKLKGASEEELSRLERDEINSVIKQLKAQQDIMLLQKDLKAKIKAQKAELDLQKQRNNEFGKELQQQEEHNKWQDDIIKQHSEKDMEQDRLIAENTQKNIEHDRALAETSKKDISQDKEIVRQAAESRDLERKLIDRTEKDESQDKEIARQAAKDEELMGMIKQMVEINQEKEEQIRALETKCEKLGKDITDNLIIIDDREKNLLDFLNKKADKKTVIISYAIGITSLIAAFLQFFI